MCEWGGIVINIYLPGEFAQFFVDFKSYMKRLNDLYQQNWLPHLSTVNPGTFMIYPDHVFMAYSSRIIIEIDFLIKINTLAAEHLWS